MHGKRFCASLQNLYEEYYCEPQIQQILYNSFLYIINTAMAVSWTSEVMCMKKCKSTFFRLGLIWFRNIVFQHHVVCKQLIIGFVTTVHI
jgi:hypothetical protein